MIDRSESHKVLESALSSKRDRKSSLKSRVNLKKMHSNSKRARGIVEINIEDDGET
jgi:hypothetical protein